MTNPFEQGLFWNNLPIKKIKRLGFLEEQITHGILFIKEYPYLIYTGTQRICFDILLENQKLIRKLKKCKELHIYLFEPISFFIKGENYNLGYYSEFHNSLNQEVGSEELDSISEFVNKTGINVVCHTCDYGIKKYVQDKYQNFKIICDDIFLRGHAKPLNGINKNKNITHKFWSANGRYTVHRHLIMCHLADKSGRYSWHFKTKIDDHMKSIGWLDDELPWNYLIKNNDILNKSKFKLDGGIRDRVVEKFNRIYIPDITHGDRDSFLDTYRYCFCAIVNETRFAQPTGNFSEKLLNTIAMETPFVLVAPPRTLEYAKKLGFKTFDKWWDESYDLEENHSKRLKKVFELIDYINSKSIEELNIMYNEMIPILRYNNNYLEKFRMHEIIL